MSSMDILAVDAISGHTVVAALQCMCIVHRRTCGSCKRSAADLRELNWNVVLTDTAKAWALRVTLGCGHWQAAVWHLAKSHSRVCFGDVELWTCTLYVTLWAQSGRPGGEHGQCMCCACCLREFSAFAVKQGRLPTGRASSYALLLQTWLRSSQLPHSIRSLLMLCSVACRHTASMPADAHIMQRTCTKPHRSTHALC